MKDETLAAHNAVRLLEGKPPLQWCDQCAASAQAWADKLAVSQQLNHGGFSHSHQQGQNLAMGGKNFTITKAVSTWVSEKANYRPRDDFAYQPRCGHYTQVVSPRSTHCGTGIARNGNHVYVVTNYCPPGN